MPGPVCPSFAPLGQKHVGGTLFSVCAPEIEDRLIPTQKTASSASGVAACGRMSPFIWGEALLVFVICPRLFCYLLIAVRVCLINLSAIYKSAVEYEQRMKKRPLSKFGAALVQEYRRRGFTQYSLAKKMERSARYLNNLEHDRSEPRFTTILLLADAIGMDPGELVDAAARLTWAAHEEEEAGPITPEEQKTAPKKTGSKKSQKK